MEAELSLTNVDASEITHGGITSDMIAITSPKTLWRSQSTIPSWYRLARKSTGEVVLQGAFHWQEGFTSSGFEWRDLPTVDIDD